MSILILALLVVNIALTAVMMLSTTGAMKSTTALVGKIASALDFEMDIGTDTGLVSPDVLVGYSIDGSMTVPLKMTDDGIQHYGIFNVSIQMDSSNKDYKKKGGENIADKADLVKGEIFDAVSSHTIAEFQNDIDGIRNEVLQRLRSLYQSDFIYKVIFSEVKSS